MELIHGRSYQVEQEIFPDLLKSTLRVKTAQSRTLVCFFSNCHSVNVKEIHESIKALMELAHEMSISFLRRNFKTAK